MGFKEEVIQEYEAKEAADNAKKEKENREAIEKRIAEVKEKARKFFGLLEDPEIEVFETGGYYPDFSFVVDDVKFLALNGSYGHTFHVVQRCEKCGEEYHSHSVRSRYDVGRALTDTAHACVITTTQKSSAPLKTAIYAVDTPEIRLIEAVKDMIYDHAPMRED